MTTPQPHRIFDRSAYHRRRAREPSAETDQFLVREAAEQLSGRIASINRSFASALDLNSRVQSFEILRGAAQNWTHSGDTDQADVVADDEFLPFRDASFDLLTSVLSLHAVNDLPGTLLQIRRVLKPDGVFMAALFGGDTLQELRLAFTAAEAAALGGASPRVAPFADVRELGGLLQRAGFALPVADLERTTVRYREPMRLMADLRALGETNVLVQRRPNFLSRRLLAGVISEYGGRFSDEQGRISATFDIVYLMGWAPDDSQPKPVRPGSAHTRLADTLKSRD